MNADAAIEALTKAVGLDSQNAEAYRLLGYAHEIKEEYSKALEYYDIALGLDAQNADILTSRGHMHELTGDYGKAEKDYEAALAVDSVDSLALINLAGIYIATDRTAEYDIELMLNQAFKNTSDSRIAAEVFNLMGTLYVEEGDQQKARSAFQESLLYDSRLTASWMGRAFADVELLADVTDDAVFGQMMGSITEAIDSALFLNKDQTTAYMLQGIIAGTYGADPAVEKALYEQALGAIDKDITLNKARKTEMRTRIQSLMAEIDADDSELREIKADITSDVNAQ
jgi:tetratricopeptide (TPR) repeat protein